MDYADWTTTGALGDRYVLRTRVGAGRTTTVYIAEDVRLERQVAVKLFHDLPDPDGLARFAAEAEVLAGLSHPGLVTVYDVGLAADPPYMVMRLVDGGPLSDFIADVYLDPAVVARLGAQLADVLAYVHERGVVHGDLDARNVLIDAPGTAHLTGFGADGGRGRPSGDIYALGMLLNGCLADGVGPEWDVVLAAMTDEDPNERPDAIRCGELFRNIASGDTADIPLLPGFEADPEDADPEEREPPAERKPPPAERPRPAYAGLVGMALAITALGIVVATVTSGPPREQTGEQQNPPAEQPAQDENHPQPPGQSYPPAPVQREAPQSNGKRKPSRTTTPPTSEAPPGEDGNQGNGRGGGNRGNGNGNNDENDGGLLGGILGGLL